MNQGAKVDDIEVLLSFRVQLIKFVEACNTALGDADTDVQRHIMWLENDQQAYWQGQIRSRKEALSRAMEALRQKQIFKDSTGRTPSAVEEQKAVMAAKKRLQEAEEKLAKVKQWAKRLQKEAMLYKGQVQRFSTAIMSDMPAAIAHLGALAERLTAYASLGPAGGEGGLDQETAAYFGVTPQGSMARGEGAPMPQAASGYAELRSRIPAALALREAPAMDEPPMPWQVNALAEKESQDLANLPVNWQPVSPDDRVVLAKGAPAGQRIFFARLPSAGQGDSGWYIGPADPTLDQTLVAVRIKDLLSARPDLAQILAVPAGFLVILDRIGVSAVVNERDENIWVGSAQAPAT
ncbi:MAG TPA: hypothetical protein VMD30_04145 [Tepidisphaeraceae bacterium]|nr:hypothetical protein [Tepidisphaeraceae bacterium]